MDASHLCVYFPTRRIEKEKGGGGGEGDLLIIIQDMNLSPFLVVDDGRHFRSFFLNTWRGGKSRVPLVNETTFHTEKEETRKKKKGNKLLFALFVSCVCRPKRIKNGRGVLEWDGHSSSYRRRQVVIRRTKNQEGKNGHNFFFY